MVDKKVAICIGGFVQKLSPKQRTFLKTKLIQYVQGNYPNPTYRPNMTNIHLTCLEAFRNDHN